MTDDNTFFVSVTLSDDHYRLIGKIIADYSILEHLVNTATAGILGLSDEEGRVVLSQMNIRPKLEILTLLVPTRTITPNLLDDYKARVKDIEKAQQYRRLVAHGVWARDNSGNVRLIQSWGGTDQRQRLEFVPHEMDTETLTERWEHINETLKAFQRWWKDARNDMIPSPYRPV